MKNQKSIFAYLFSIVAVLALLMFISGCSEKSSLTEAQLGDKEAMTLLVQSDEDILSFEPNYNEDAILSAVLGKAATAFYPVKVGHKMTLVSKDLQLEAKGDTAYGRLVKNFSGELFIAGSFSASSGKPDTVIKKLFTTAITRQIIFVKDNDGAMNGNGNSGKRLNKEWKIAAISLPSGGTLSLNTAITKMTIVLPSESIEIVNPNDFYLLKNAGRKRQIPNLGRGELIKVRVEVTSAYADTDFVSLTYGADQKGFNRTKKHFRLIEIRKSLPYIKVYEAEYITHQFMGHFHAVVNVMPRISIYDDKSPVETSTWGIPYWVNK